MHILCIRASRTFSPKIDSNSKRWLETKKRIKSNRYGFIYTLLSQLEGNQTFL